VLGTRALLLSFGLALPLAAAGCATRASSAPASSVPTAATAPPAGAAAAESPQPGARLSLRLTAPAGTPAGASIYLAGSFNGWNPGNPEYRLVPQGGSLYTLTVPHPLSGGVEFKFTLGSWETVEVTATGGSVPNRTLRLPETGTLAWEGAVEGWTDPARQPVRASTATRSVAVLDTAFAMPQLGRTRRVWIYLPPDYATSSKRYPVLYMHDGQNVFDAATSGFGEWGVDETMDSLQAAGDWGAIVVAVDHGGTRRLDEYSPWRNPRYGGGEGDAYVEFLVRTLKPYVDAHYRTRPGRRDTGIAGSSMGGLISLYAALKHSEVFGGAGVFSPALWFAPAIYGTARAAHPPAGGLRLRFVTGAQEGDEPAVYVAGQVAMLDSLRAAGFAPPDLDAVVRADGRHQEWFWRREFPRIYHDLFASPTPAAAH
jgi:metallo-beta-lactamase class B